MAKVITLSNGREWKTQKDALDHFRRILRSYDDDTVIDDPVHHDDLAALLERYDMTITNAPSKIGCGIAHFMRRLNYGVGYSTAGFWVVRTDGTKTDFSFPHAVKGKPKQQAHEFADACRAAVTEDLKSAKKRHFDRFGDGEGRVLCDLTNQPITLQEAHLSHAPPTFGCLVVMFRTAFGLHAEIPAGTLTPPQDKQTTTTFSNIALADAFREFHRKRAVLRVIAAKRNVAISENQRIQRVKHPVEI